MLLHNQEVDISGLIIQIIGIIQVFRNTGYEWYEGRSQNNIFEGFLKVAVHK